MSTNRDALVERVAEALDYLVQMARGHDYADDLKITEAEDEIRAALDALPELAQAQAAVARVRDALRQIEYQQREGYDRRVCGYAYETSANWLRAALAGPEPTDPEREV